MTITEGPIKGFKETEIGVFPNDWETTKLQQIAEVQPGYPFPSSEFSEEPTRDSLPLIRIRDLLTGKSDTYFTGQINQEVLDCYTVKAGDILIGMDGNFHTVRWKGNDGLLNQRIARLRNFSEKSHNIFVFYSILSPIKRIEDVKHFTTVKHLSMKDLLLLVIPLPPLLEQQNIASVLSTIQEAKEKTEIVIRATKELKKSMMKHLFTYGPVPVEDAEKVPLKETEIGMIPEHWEVTQLNDVIREQIKNGAFVRREQFGKGVPFLNVADTYGSVTVDMRLLDRVDCSDNDLKLYDLKPNDLIYVRSSLKREGIGQCCIVEKRIEPAIYDCHLMRVRVKEDKIIPKCLAYFSLSIIGKQALIANSKTTTMTTINQSGLGNFQISMPPLSEQKQISETLSAIDDKISSEENKKQSLETLFKTLLFLLMTGKLRVKDLDIPV